MNRRASRDMFNGGDGWDGAESNLTESVAQKAARQLRDAKQL